MTDEYYETYRRCSICCEPLDPEIWSRRLLHCERCWAQKMERPFVKRHDAAIWDPIPWCEWESNG
jgi:hypothetical protein